MKFSKNWLTEWVNPNKTTAEICQQLTDAGLEVDAFEPAAPEFTGVIVAEITSAEQHPDADRLKVCQVNTGSDTVQIVCGGKNARTGIKVALATVGAVLPGNFKIKPAKLRGIASQGMLCSEVEIGLADSSVGIMELPADAPLGVSIREYLQLDDDIIDIDLTPNRGDCLSIKGVAREVGVLNDVPVNEVKVETIAPETKDTINIKVKEDEACPRYCARRIKNINTNVTTPLWLQERLRRSGIRSIHPVVDVCNYVMLEIGQPMHAFDADKISNEIVVRFPSNDETLVLLDEQEAKLKSNTLIIADHDKPLAIAGIMGGRESSVTDATTNIILESAFFNPSSIRGKAKLYGLHTDSSHRFERGVDPSLTLDAIERATSLIKEICGGEAGPINEVVTKKYLPTVKTIGLRRAQIARILGFTIPDDKVIEILNNLGLQVEDTNDGWRVVTPLHRFDINIEVDLIEELARIYGYQHIPSTLPLNLLQMLPKSETQKALDEIRHIMVQDDYHETMSYSFIAPKLEQLFHETSEGIELQNPIASDLSIMRQSLLPSLIAAVKYNQQHQQERIRLFEIGTVFYKEGDGIAQPQKLAAIASGARHHEQWGHKSEKIDFYDIKKSVETLVPSASFVKENYPALHPGQSAKVMRGNDSIGWIGALHPRIMQQMKLSGPIFVFELDVAKIEQNLIPKYQTVTKFPIIRRDLAIVVDEGVPFLQVYDIVEKSAGMLLKDLNIFDIYQGEGIKPGYKSLALALTLQHPERTLVDEEVANIMQNVIENLQTTVQAELRD